MSRINDENYYQVSGWMINRLGLKGTELQVFAIIYGFSQDGESWFTGSLGYLEDWTGATKPTVIKALKELVGKEFIIKESTELNNMTFNKYKANLPHVKNFTTSKEILRGSKESLLNNNIYNNTNIVSKDTILDTGSTQNTPKPTQSSGKLFTSSRNTSKNSLEARTNRFITACQREATKKQFTSEVLAELDKFFRMLGEMQALLPSVSIAEQLTHLAKVPQHKQVDVIKNTVSRGWKSLQYAAEEAITGRASRSSFVDTASPNTFTATPEEEKNGDWKNNIPEDHIF